MENVAGKTAFIPTLVRNYNYFAINIDQPRDKYPIYSVFGTDGNTDSTLTKETLAENEMPIYIHYPRQFLRSFRKANGRFDLDAGAQKILNSLSITIMIFLNFVSVL